MLALTKPKETLGSPLQRFYADLIDDPTSPWLYPHGRPEPEPPKPDVRLSRGGKKGADTKRETAARTQSRALKLAKQILAKKSSISQPLLAAKICQSQDIGYSVPHMIRIIRKWEKSGELAARPRVIPSLVLLLNAIVALLHPAALSIMPCISKFLVHSLRNVRCSIAAVRSRGIHALTTLEA